MEDVEVGGAMDMTGTTHQTIDPDYDDMPPLLDPSDADKIPYAVPQYILDITTDPELIKEIMAAEEVERLRTRKAADDDDASERLALQLQLEEEERAKRNFVRAQQHQQQSGGGFGGPKQLTLMVCLDKRVQKDEKPSLAIKAQPFFQPKPMAGASLVAPQPSAAIAPLFGPSLASPPKNSSVFAITPPDRPSVNFLGDHMSPTRLIKNESLPSNYVKITPASNDEAAMRDDDMSSSSVGDSDDDSDSEGDDINPLDDVRPVKVSSDATVAELMIQIVKSDIFPIRKVSHIKHLSMYSPPKMMFPVFGSMNTDTTTGEEGEWSILSNRLKLFSLNLSNESIIKVTLRKKGSLCFGYHISCSPSRSLFANHCVHPRTRP
jgi:hypothetical protein